MASELLDFGPETPGEELRFETVQRAAQVYERAKRIRMLVVFVTFVVAVAAPWPVLFPLAGNAPTSAPAVLGICLFASLLRHQSGMVDPHELPELSGVIRGVSLRNAAIRLNEPVVPWGNARQREPSREATTWVF